MARLRILIADAHDVFRRGLRSLLTAHPGWTVCGEARSGVDAVQLASQLKPDVVILGLDLTELSGTDATRRIKRVHPTTEVLVYTVHDEEHLIAEALMAGANGHVMKSDTEDTLIEAVSTLAKHSPYFSTKAAETLLDHLVKDPESANIDALTDREREIVKVLADGKSNKQIAAHLQISVKTVETHRSAIMRKLRFKSITELVRYAIRSKLIQP